mmetsp:Transcript_1685/g.3319  ORF Transcript_1685/g.3319 Transcript_1685/m.3319 type:complete len:536 (-) Transcript_1685:2796-4403(-)
MADEDPNVDETMDLDEDAAFEDDADDGGFDDADDAAWGDENKEDDDGWGDVVQDDAPPPLSGMDDNPLTRQISAVNALSAEDIDIAVQEKVKVLAEELSLEERKCLLLLRKYKWNAALINDVYFNDPDKILVEAGVCVAPKSDKEVAEQKSKQSEMECGVCMDDVPISQTFCLECGHLNTCNKCWIEYLCDGVKTKQCVHLTCPTHKCYVTIPQDVWGHFLADKHPNEYARYLRFCRENFVENSKEFAFCPGKSCDMIYSSESGVAKEIVCTGCKFRFCWACKNDSHFPGSCHAAEKWLQKCSSEAENISWILAKTKRCPKCHVHIEKNQGCNHMTCRKHAGGCGHEFCWLCKGDWSKHGSATGGYYQCNIYEKNKADGKTSDEDAAQTNAQNELERYEFHYTRYDSHSKSSKHAIKQKETTHEKMHQLAEKFQWRLNETQFLLDAVTEAIQCWHVLAWTYPIAYYLDDKKFNLDLFKQQQGQLEHFCDGLQQKLDFDLDKLGDNKTRQEIIGYTRTAQKYRKNLVEYIESDVSF